MLFPEGFDEFLDELALFEGNRILVQAVLLRRREVRLHILIVQLGAFALAGFFDRFRTGTAGDLYRERFLVELRFQRCWIPSHRQGAAAPGLLAAAPITLTLTFALAFTLTLTLTFTLAFALTLTLT